jgi:hypothetical protein
MVPDTIFLPLVYSFSEPDKRKKPDNQMDKLPPLAGSDPGVFTFSFASCNYRFLTFLGNLVKVWGGRQNK